MLPAETTLLILALIAAGMVTGCLRVLGDRFHRRVRLHDLKVEVHALRNEYLERLAEDGRDDEAAPRISIRTEPLTPAPTLLSEPAEARDRRAA